MHGHAAVRDYWTGQWAAINPSVEPLLIVQRADGRVIVEVHQVVRALDGTLLSEQVVQHVYQLDAGRILQMEIQAPDHAA